MKDEIKKAADALYNRAFHNLMEARGEKLQSTFSQRQNRQTDIATSGIAFGRMRKVLVDFVGEDMNARLISFEQAFEHANAVPTAGDFAEILSAVEDVYQGGLRSVATRLKRHRQQGRVGIARVDEESGDLAHQHDRVLREFNVWRSKLELLSSKRISADEQTSPGARLDQWLGAELSTKAIVFTDILRSTELSVELGDFEWRKVWQQHLARVNDLVSQQHGFLVNKIGDSVLTIFQNALHAVAFAMALISDSGHPRVRLRIGIHMGLVNQEMVKGDNVSGQDVSFAQRVMSEATDGGIIVSHPVRQDFEKMGMINDPKKRWIDLVNVLPKGFPEPTRLWRIEAVSE